MKFISRTEVRWARAKARVLDFLIVGGALAYVSLLEVAAHLRRSR